jgi:4-alpha-glucanotransferase
MKFSRAGGILLHPTSLPGRYGIGDLGPQAYRFVDWLASSGCKLWQILPLGPTGYGDSPYQCFSAFAGNPYLISFDDLMDDGLLTQEDFNDMPAFDSSGVDYGTLIPWKLELLQRAFSRLPSTPDSFRKEVKRFSRDNASWLEDYALFMSLKEANGGGAWSEWHEAVRNRKTAAMEKARAEHADNILRHSFYQFLFFRQWEKLREYVHEHGITIIGDIPIFVAYDSADVWANPKLFFLDENSLPSVVAGVPPDYFSATGQLWGNPLYKWSAHKKTGYAWWLERFRSVLKLVDIVRLDHFRGFAGYYEIPFGSPTAEQGRWVAGPGKDFFETLTPALRSKKDETLPIIAEDLGVITPDVVELRNQFNLPGMKILQFGFTKPDDPFLPHNYPSNCVAYTGTHDNDTVRGWYDSAPEHERDFARRYLDSNGSDIARDMVRCIWSSVAVYALAPMQDLLSLGGQARMNFPSRLGGNWEWRLGEGELSESLAGRLREMNYLYLR